MIVKSALPTSIRQWGLLLTLPALAAAFPALGAEIRGRVETDVGAPVNHARVTDRATGHHVLTDATGAFALKCALPCVLAVTHPWLDAQEIVVKQGGELRVALEGGHDEQIVVTASRGVGDTYAPISLPSTLVHTDDRLDAPASLLELVRQAPGVAENGQGGLFQVLSIRGISRQRVATLISGMPVVSDRRAGASASFIDPLLLEGAEVLRGPSSTYYGSGALGGVVQMFPRRSDGWRLQAGYEGFGDESYLAGDWGNGGWSVGFSRRSRGNDEAADGIESNSHFTQYSTTISRRWRGGALEYEVLAIAGLGRDIGKSNRDFPQRITDYPQETHTLLKFGIVSDTSWRLHVFVHPNDLRTEALGVGDMFSVVENEALDAGAAFRRDFDLSSHFKGRVGLDYFGRYGVEARERGRDLVTGVPFAMQTLDGNQDDAAVYATFDWNWGSGTLQGGSRLVWHRQEDAATPGRDDNGWIGFLGLTQPLAAGLELVANAGTGLRFPSLSERFFTGTTGRGSVIGNPDLRQEDSLNTDVGLRFSGKRVLVSGSLFRTEIDDYIERFDVATDVQSFVNLTSGTIEGVELDGLWHPSRRWQLAWGATRIEGEEDGSGRPLPDIPAHRGRLGLRFRAERWEASLDYEHRSSKNDPGSGERAIAGADLVSAAVELRLNDSARLRLRARNLLDEVYLNSADEKSAAAAGRSFGIGMVWNP